MSTSDSDPADASAENSDVHADEDWKQQVKAENASFDATLKAESQQTASPAPSEEADAASESAANEPSSSETSERPSSSEQMPPATFEALVSLFSTQAMVALGIIPNPATGKAEQFPDLARHFIDLLGVLETKTAGNLEQHEKTLLDTTLHHLRMAYVQSSGSTESSADSEGEST